MKKAGGSTVLAVIVLCCFFWAAGCISVEPEIAGTPTPSSSPTPMPEAFAPELTAAPLPTDQLGKIVETDDHYYSYLSFGDVRVYGQVHHAVPPLCHLLRGLGGTFGDLFERSDQPSPHDGS